MLAHFLNLGYCECEVLLSILYYMVNWDYISTIYSRVLVLSDGLPYS